MAAKSTPKSVANSVKRAFWAAGLRIWDSGATASSLLATVVAAAKATPHPPALNSGLNFLCQRTLKVVRIQRGEFRPEVMGIFCYSSAQEKAWLQVIPALLACREVSPPA